MTTKHIYLVRHGQSFANLSGVGQGADSELTDKGKKQAELVGDRLGTYGIERIISSPYVRAHQTATIIAARMNTIVHEQSELFVERRNPSFMVGMSVRDPKVQYTWETIAQNYGIPGWRYADEENFEDLRDRTKKALSFLEALPEERILITSHGLFMKVILAHILLGDHLNGRIFWDQFIPIKNIENTGIMYVAHMENYHKTAKHWKLISWNDHAHLK
jgi:broad specificity phosphatase PhoE